MKNMTSSQIGGKGTIRRKNKGKPNLKKKPNNEENEFNSILGKINNLIKQIPEDNSEHWGIYMDEFWEETIQSFGAKDFPKNKFDIDAIKENINEFYANFIKYNNDRVLFKMNYNLYIDTFSKRGYDKILFYIDELESEIKEEDYIPEKPQISQDNINEQFDILELDKTIVPTKSQLKVSYYRKSAEFHPDKHPNEMEKYTVIFEKINKAFKILTEYYHKNNKNFNIDS